MSCFPPGERVWLESDLSHALHEIDRQTIFDAEALRALILERLVRRDEAPRDLYTACARLGRFFAEAGASPTIASTTLDGAVLALTAMSVAIDAPRIANARASVIEGYASAIREAERGLARRHWEYPACAVRVSDDTATIAAGYPVDDVEASVIADWAARVALGLSRDRIRHVVLQGPSPIATELREALSLVGIQVRTASGEDAPERAPKARWLRFPFGRG